MPLKWIFSGIANVGSTDLVADAGRAAAAAAQQRSFEAAMTRFPVLLSSTPTVKNTDLVPAWMDASVTLEEGDKIEISHRLKPPRFALGASKLTKDFVHVERVVRDRDFEMRACTCMCELILRAMSHRWTVQVSFSTNRQRWRRRGRRSNYVVICQEFLAIFFKSDRSWW